MAITLEAIRAAGGIVHSDGNIFFRDISMLQGLAGAAPAAVAGQVLDARAIAAAVCQRVAELPDRDSPADWPEAMLVTGQELIDVVTCELEQAQAAPTLEAPAASTRGGEHYDELRATLTGLHTLCENISAIERRVGPLGSHARGYTHKITAALRHLDALAAAPQAPNCTRCSGSGEDPEGYLTHGRGPDDHTVDGPCRSCDGTGAAPQAPAAPVAAAIPDAAYCALQYVEHALAAIANREELADGAFQPMDSIGKASKRAKAALTRLQSVAHHFSAVAAPAAPSDAQLLSEWDRVSGITKATERRLACMRSVLQRWGSAAPAAPAVDAGALRDAEHYRFIKRHRLILSGGTETFGWPIAPFGDECDRYISKELDSERAAQAAAKGEHDAAD